MKILHISKYYYPYIGGIEMTARYLATGLKGHDNRVVCFNTEKEYSEEVIDGIKVYRMSNDLFIARQSISFGYKKHLLNILTDFDPDVVHLHCPNPYIYPFITKLLSSKCKLVLHWHLDVVKQKLIYPLIKSFETSLLKRADMICVTSPNYRDDSKPLQPYLNKVEILQSAIETDKLIEKESDKELVKNLEIKYERKPIVFFVGRHVEYKGLRYLLEASKFVTSDCKIVIAGNGPLTEKLKAMDYDKNKVEFVGRVSDDELRCYLKVAKVFAFPSVTKNEAFGLSLAEAMYMGCVPVTFTIYGSGVNWVSVNGETGIEVPNGNSQKYAEAIDKLISDDELRLKYSYAAHKRVVDYFIVDKEIEKANYLYRKLFINKCL